MPDIVAKDGDILIELTCACPGAVWVLENRAARWRCTECRRLGAHGRKMVVRGRVNHVAMGLRFETVIECP